jgi:hypothetical protein
MSANSMVDLNATYTAYLLQPIPELIEHFDRLVGCDDVVCVGNCMSTLYKSSIPNLYGFSSTLTFGPCVGSKVFCPSLSSV